MKLAPRSPWFSLVLLLAALGAAGCSSPAAPSTPLQPEKIAPADAELVDESWQANFLNGAKLGHGHAVVRRIAGDDGDVIRSSVTQSLRIQRFGQTTEETLDFACDDSPEGQILSFHCQADAMGLKAQGQVSGGFLKLTTTTQGKTSTSTTPWDEETRGYFGLDGSLRRQPMKPGETRRVKWLQPLLHMVSDDTLTAEEVEEVDLLGEKKRLLRIQCEGTLGNQTIRRTLWTDDQGLIWKSGNIESGEENFRTSEKLAKRQDGAALDLGVSTIVKVSKTLKQPHQTRRIVYRATLKHRNPAEVFAAGGSQSIKPIDEHTAEITVREVSPSEPESIEPPPTQPEAGDRAANNLIQSDDRLVRKMAAELAAGETDPAAIAFALERGVREKVSDKNFSTAFASAADVAKSLSGDCTEHAVLLAALCRAQKIPARVAAGLIYSAERPKQKMPQGFAYHMWTEAWLNGRWVPLDATLGRGGIGAAHLKLSDSNLSGANALEVVLPVMNVLGQLELEIVEVE